MRILRVSHSAVVSAWRARERELTRLGNHVELITAFRWNEGGHEVTLSPEPEESVIGARTWGRHPALFLYDPRPLWRALGRRWDVIDIHEEPYALATAEVLLIRALRRQQAPYALYSAQNIYKRYPVPFRWLERWALRNARAVIVCNAEAGTIVQRKGYPGRPDLIPLGVDVGRYRDVEAASAILTRLDGVHVGYVGRLEPHKGVDVLLDAVARRTQLRLTLVGGGTMESALRRRVDEEGLASRVTILGSLPEDSIPSVLKRFDVLAVPSRTTDSWVEQFGRVAVEAMAAGVPVVASESGALPDVVGEGGLLVPEGDPDALGDALLRVGTDADLARELVARGRTVADRADWAHVAASYLRVYRRMAKKAHRRTADENPPEILVVAFGSRELLGDALEPLKHLDVTVIDNSSLPEIAALCAELGVRYLDPRSNRGFAAGVNYGLLHRQHPDRDLLLLNPDAVIDPEGVAVLHRHLRSDATLASVAPRQVDATGHPTRVAWPWPTPWRSWLEAVGLGRLGRQGDYVIGSILLLRAEALDEVGPLDEHFPLYAEETDWAMRAAALGWRHELVPDVVAIHVGGATSGDAHRREKLFYAGQERLMRKHYGALGWQLARAGQILGAEARARILRGERGAQARRRATILRSGPLRSAPRLEENPGARG